MDEWKMRSHGMLVTVLAGQWEFMVPNLLSRCEGTFRNG
jgi:hypothetical protein